MAHFGKELWLEIAPRFKELRGEKIVEKFLADNDLLGLKWRAMEEGRQGISVESLAKLADALDASPTWVLFGAGPKKLSECRSAQQLKRVNLQKEISHAAIDKTTSDAQPPRKKTGKT